MSTAFDQIQLQSVQDYKFFAFVIGQKLRNPNFKSQWLQVFIKTFLQQIRSLSDLANIKHQQEQQQKQRQKKQSNRREKNLVKAKVVGKTDKYGRDMDDIESSDEDNYSDEEY